MQNFYNDSKNIIEDQKIYINNSDNFILCLAVFQNNLELTKLLIMLNPSLEIINNFSLGLTPLHLATINNYPKILKLLLASGANVNIQNIEDHIAPPLHAAIYSNHKENCKRIINK